MTDRQMDINPYVREDFEPRFRDGEIFKRLQQEFDVISFDHNFDPSKYIDDTLTPNPTPRELWGLGINHLTQLGLRSRSVFSAVAFYYLEFITRHDPQRIYDLGCGWNIFKRYIPQIHGISAETPGSPSFFADEWGFVDGRYMIDHKDYFESVFSINALHFLPLSGIRHRVTDFIGMIKPGGTGFLALNVMRMIEHDKKFLDWPNQAIEDFVREQLYDLPCELQVFDVDMTNLNELMEGNIRLVMTK